MRCGLLVVVLGATRVASAQPQQLAGEFQAGVDAYRLGNYDEARKHLEAARAVDPKLPGPHRFLAAVAQAQGRWDDCIGEARTAMELNPRSSEIDDTRKLHDGCRASAGRAPYRGELGDSAAIAVTTNVPGATIKINGLTYGGTPLAPRPITAGSLEIEIVKPGWKSVTRTVDALAGIVTDLAVDLEADPTAQTTVEIAPNATGSKKKKLQIKAPGATILVDGQPATEEVDPGTHIVEVRAPGHDPWRRRVRIDTQNRTVTPDLVITDEREATERRGFYILSAGGAILAAGFVATLLSHSAAAEANDIERIERTRDPSRPLSETGAIAPVRTRADLEDANDRAARWSLISNVTYGLGLVTVGVGAYVLYRGAKQRSEGSPPFAVAPIRGGALIAKELAW